VWVGYLVKRGKITKWRNEKSINYDRYRRRLDSGGKRIRGREKMEIWP